jgi:type IV pilus biogenesis protein CpaD/CtpE
MIMKTLKTISILVPILLAGCYPLEDNYRHTNQAREWTKWKPKPELYAAEENYVFQKGQVHLNKHQSAQLTKLVKQFGEYDANLDGNTAIFVKVKVYQSLDRFDTQPLMDRIRSLVKKLIRAGIPNSSIDIVPEETPSNLAGNTFTVIVELARMPRLKCDGWNYHVGRNVWPIGEPDYGCANANNLAMMLDNPHDIVEGRELFNSEAAREDVYTGYFIKDKVRPLLKNEKIFNTK